MQADRQNRLGLTDMPDVQPVVATAVKGVAGIAIFLLVGFIVITFEGNAVWMIVLTATAVIAVYFGLRLIRHAVGYGSSIAAYAHNRDDDGRTPLHHAAMLGKVDLARTLIANGADINARDDLGGTPLWYAVTERHLSITRLLLEEGAEVKEEMTEFARIFSSRPMTELLNGYWMRQQSPPWTARHEHTEPVKEGPSTQVRPAA